MVYVVSKSGKPLMPTERYGKVRRMLKNGEAVVIKRVPFTIQLQYDSKEYTQDLTLGVDAGSKKVGLSVSSDEKEVFSGELELRNNITNLLSVRKASRKGRRNRKTRYRKARFDNRRKSEGWMAPSIQNKIDSHLKIINDLKKILPISKIIIEVASFDTQKLKADIEGLQTPEGIDYQHGEQLGFWNVREYILHRDNYTCQCCKGKSGDKVLNVHHIESRKTGGNSPGNLITLCEYCHKEYHEGKVKLPDVIKRKASMRDAAFMGIMRWAFYNKLKEMYHGEVSMTYGYITKNTRIQNGIQKTHAADALCIAGHPKAIRASEFYNIKKVRCHNRQIHKMTFLKGGNRKRNQASYLVKGFRLFDRIMFDGKECFIVARRNSGFFNLRKLNGESVNPSVSYKKLILLSKAKKYLWERKTVDLVD